MVNETNPLESSDPVDPLSNYSSFSLFPNFASSSSASFSLTENPNHDNLRSHLKDMVSQSPDNLMNQAKAILDGNLNLITSDKTKATVHEDQSAAVLTVNDKIPKERRPGLGRKRAKFTMKPMPSLPDVSLEPTIDIDELSDPEEYFAACERMDNAKKELRKQMGLPLIDLDQNRASMPARRRRPGLGLGRKVTYKRHPYPSIGFRDNDEVLLSSQEAPDPSVKSPSREEVIPEKNVMHFSPVATVSDVKVSMHNIGSELDDLLSCNFEELDEDGVQNLLQDKLNIKLVDIGKASLPGLPDVRGRDRERSSGAGTSMDTVNHENGTSRAVSSFSYHLRKSSTNHQVSPSLSKRPLASLAMVNRHISKLSPAKDPFSLIDIASSPVKTSSLGKHNTKEAEEIHENPNMHESLKSSLNEVDTTGGFTSPPASAGSCGGLNNGSEEQFVEVSHSDLIVTNEVDTTGGFTSPPASAGSCGGLNNGSEEQFVEVSHSDLIVTNKKSHEFTRPVAHEEIISTSEEKLASPIRKDVMPSGDPEELADQISPTARENLFESASPPTHGEDILGNPTSKPAEQEDRVAEARESVQEELFNKGSASMSLSSDKGEDGRIGETLKLKSSLKKPNKKAVGSLKSKRTETGDSMVPQETVCEETVNKGRKGKAKSSAPISKEPKLKKRRVEVPVPVPGEVDRILRRHSLYGAGTKWEAGLRRSTRIRMRPLEYWRGERVLYGRVNQSLVSVIGVKYASSTKNAEEYGVTVESFVSDQYKDLLDLASVH